ncbi:hypothetical protein M9H77_02740 [Catharanthus roseus]|uniref:Uncharacterized protein n=1 Tax=Catharanthus roseus TaxID=4058 RepID=A0ACC0C9F6_CATRO|nr:hypothetical protein M9H77_02740 [Catharanthus roseus]
MFPNNLTSSIRFRCSMEHTLNKFISNQGFVYFHVSSNASIKTQSSVLGNLYMAKWKTNSSIDKTHYSADVEIKENEILCENQHGLREKDRIHRLPGQPNGKVDLNVTAGVLFITTLQRLLMAPKICLSLAKWSTISLKNYQN